MIALLGTFFSGIGGKLVGYGMAVIGLLGAVFAVRQSGVNEEATKQKLQELKGEIKDRETVDEIAADVGKPGSAPAVDQLRARFSRD